MKKNLMLLSAAFVAILCLSSCKDDEVSVVDKIALRQASIKTVELTQRTLSVTPGYDAPKDDEGETIATSDLYVDLGVGVKFAVMNVGATEATDPGERFGWGEIETKGNVSWSSYDYHDYYEQNANAEKDPATNGGLYFINKYCYDIYGEINDCSKGQTLLTNDDVAYVQWGSDWRMPTAADFEKIFSNIDLTSDGSDDDMLLTAFWDSETNCLVVSNKYTGAELTLPCVSHITDRGILYQRDGSYAGYWTSTLSSSHSTKACCYHPTLYKGAYRVDQYRFYGYYVRPVLAE